MYLISSIGKLEGRTRGVSWCSLVQFLDKNTFEPTITTMIWFERKISEPNKAKPIFAIWFGLVLRQGSSGYNTCCYKISDSGHFHRKGFLMADFRIL